MDYTHGRHSHHHHHHHDDDRREEEAYPPPGQPYPPPYYGGNEPPPGQPHPPPYYGVNEPPPPYPPPPRVHHTSHIGPGPDAYPSPLPPTFTNYAPPPPVVDVPRHHPHMPHLPSAFDHHTHHNVDEFANKPSVRMYCKAETNYSLTVRDGKVILARSNPSDPFQHWIKDEKFSTRVKDEQGFPSFALVNKATRQAMKHSIGATHPVQLIPYNPEVPDESILWTESKDLGDTYRAIRMVNNIRLNVDAFHGDKNHGGVHDGSIIVLWEWKKGDNQRWKIVPY